MKKFIRVLKLVLLSIYPISGLIDEKEFESLGEPEDSRESKKENRQ